MYELKLSDKTSGLRVVGSRSTALLVRDEIEKALESGETVRINMHEVEPTQSFIDEMVGILVLQKGPDVLDRIRFSNCSVGVKSILNFVVSDRAEAFEHRM